MEPTQDEQAAMSTEQLIALARQQAGETPVAPEAKAETETPREERQEQQAAPEQPPAEVPAAEKTGDKEVPMAHLRETARQQQARAEAAETLRQAAELEAKKAHEHNAQWQAFANNPDALRQHLATIAPAQAPDFDLDPAGAIAHHLAPLQQQLASVQAELSANKAQQAHRSTMDALAVKHGSDTPHLLAAFDQANPAYAHLHPEARLTMAQGLIAQQAKLNPQAETDRINALAAEKSQRDLAALLASGKDVKGIATLGSAPQAQQDKPAMDFATMSHDDINKVPVADLLAQLKAGHFG